MLPEQSLGEAGAVRRRLIDGHLIRP
jgi:hypothetical protein